MISVNTPTLRRTERSINVFKGTVKERERRQRKIREEIERE